MVNVSAAAGQRRPDAHRLTPGAQTIKGSWVWADKIPTECTSTLVWVREEANEDHSTLEGNLRPMKLMAVYTSEELKSFEGGHSAVSEDNESSMGR